MSTPDSFRIRLLSMIDLRHPQAVLARQLPWNRIEPDLAPKSTRQDRPGRQEIAGDLLVEHRFETGAGWATLPASLN